MVTTRIAVGLMAGTCLIFTHSLMAQVSVFNPALLEIDHQSGVDIRQFNRANMMPPGVYSVDIFINGKMFERQDVTFVQDNPDADLHACFVAIKKTLISFGVKVDALKSLNDVDETVCIDPEPRIEGSSWQLDSDKLQLNISISVKVKRMSMSVWVNYAMKMDLRQMSSRRRSFMACRTGLRYMVVYRLPRIMDQQR